MVLVLGLLQVSDVDLSPPLKTLQVISICIKILIVHIMQFVYSEFWPGISISDCI